jgi:hypothetical protein
MSHNDDATAEVLEFPSVNAAEPEAAQVAPEVSRVDKLGGRSYLNLEEWLHGELPPLGAGH